jgi:hypothetical protein
MEQQPTSRTMIELWSCCRSREWQRSCGAAVGTLLTRAPGVIGSFQSRPPRRHLLRLRRRQIVAQVRSKTRGPDRRRARRLKLCRPSSPTHPYRCGGARRHGQIHHVFLPSTLEVPHLMATTSNCVTLDRACSNPLPLPVSPLAPHCAAGWQAAGAACHPSHVPPAPLNRPPQLLIARRWRRATTTRAGRELPNLCVDAPASERR